MTHFNELYFKNKNFLWVWLGRGHVNLGCGNKRVWFVPEAILEKLEPMRVVPEYLQ